MVGPHAAEQLDSPLSLDGTLVILEGGLRPLFLKRVLTLGATIVGRQAFEQLDSLLSLDVTSVILEGGLRPLFFNESSRWGQPW